MIKLEQTADRVTFAVKARPSAKKNAVLGEHNGALKVSVTAAPEKGKANEAILQFLASQLGLKGKNVFLVRGATSSDKVIGVVGMDREQLASQIAALLEQLP